MSARPPMVSGVHPDRTLGVVRDAVRGLLRQTPAFQQLEAGARQELAHSLVRVCHTAAALIADEIETAEGLGRTVLLATSPSTPATPASPSPRGLARAQNAGTDFSGAAADRVAGTTRAILNAVSFPRFVTDLINGVFRAMTDSSQSQMQAYVELLRNVSASVDGFADAALSNARARAWVAERYPGSFELIVDEDAETTPGEPPPESELRLRAGGSWPSEGALRADLALPEDQAVPSGDPERTLVPLARLALARQRQQMLATLVMLGLQRIVVDSGRITASMRFHIDTRSAAQAASASQFGLRNEINAGGSFGVGAWGASADVHNTITYVSSQQSQTTEEMNTDLELNSGVEIVFKSDYLPLERMAGGGQIERIRANTLNPEAEAKAAGEARAAREKRWSESEQKRWEGTDKSLAPPESKATPTPVPKPAATAGSGGARGVAGSGARSAPKAGGSTEAEPATGSGAQTGTATDGQTAVSGRGVGAARGNQAPSSAGGSTAGGPGPRRTTPARTRALELEPPGGGTPPPQRRPDVIFVPTPDPAIHEMLTLAAARPGELLYDLGCGDGRIVIAAARDFGCRAVGVDLDPARIAEARAAVARAGLADQVHIRHGDLFETDLRDADIVTLYLLPGLNTRLIPQLTELRPGARIVSHDFVMEGVIPERSVQIFLPTPGILKTFHLWRAPLQFARRPVRRQWAESRGIESVR